MKIASVTLTRLGNKYLKEYVEYYKALGVDKMYFYDNNHADEEKVSDVLQEYVDNGFVEIIPFGDVEGRIQEKAYQDFYDKHGDEYDWLCVFDDDEYVTLNYGNNLKKFLELPIFNNVNGVCFPMVNFCDSGIIVNDKNTRLDVYTEIKDLGDVYNRSFYKTIIRGHLMNVSYLAGVYENNNGHFYTDGCHYPVIDGVCYNCLVDCDGHNLNGSCGSVTLFATFNGFLKHIPTGCIDDFMHMKMKRDWPDTENKQHFGYEYFLYYNNHTDEKWDYFINHVNQ